MKHMKREGDGVWKERREGERDEGRAGNGGNLALGTDV